jgi:hypothetical protein
MITNIYGFKKSVRYSCQILMNLEFSRHILQNAEISNIMKIYVMGTDLFHGDG